MDGQEDLWQCSERWGAHCWGGHPTPLKAVTALLLIKRMHAEYREWEVICGYPAVGIAKILVDSLCSRALYQIVAFSLTSIVGHAAIDNQWQLSTRRQANPTGSIAVPGMQSKQCRPGGVPHKRICCLLRSLARGDCRTVPSDSGFSGKPVQWAPCLGPPRECLLRAGVN